MRNLVLSVSDVVIVHSLELQWIFTKIKKYHFAPTLLLNVFTLNKRGHFGNFKTIFVKDSDLRAREIWHGLSESTVCVCIYIERERARERVL